MKQKSQTPAPQDHMSAKQRKFFETTQRAARSVIRRRARVLRLTRDAYVKLGAADGVMARVADDLRTMLRLAGAWARREYTIVPWKTMLYIVAAIIYFVNPIDLIPDILTGIGFVDDAAVVAAVVRAVHAQLDAFREWERRKLDGQDFAGDAKSLPAAA